MADKKRIFILGSGFSKSFSAKMPTMNDLTERLFNLNDEEFKTLIQFVQNIYQKSNQLDEFRSIENIANIIFSKRIFRNFEEEMDYEKLKFELIKFIYKEIQKQEIDRNKADTLYKFILKCSNDLRANKHDLIFNFNYDLIIENLLNLKQENRIELSYGLKFERYDTQNETALKDPKNGTLELLKLHGSFNWFRAKGSESNDIRNIYLLHKTDPMYTIHSNDIPTYIPMTNVKALFLTGTLYNTLWSKAVEHLNECDEIIFIGYGFPHTDLNNLSLFLDYREKIRYINIKKGQGIHRLDRLYQMFGKEVIYNMDAKNFIEQEILPE